MNTEIIIDGNKIPLKITAGFPYRYKAQFGEDILKTLMPFISDLIPVAMKLNKDLKGDVEDLEQIINSETITELVDALNGVEMTQIFNIIWVLAKTADKNIPDPEEWLDSFAVFPLAEILPDVFNLIIKTFSTSQESKKK